MAVLAGSNNNNLENRSAFGNAQPPGRAAAASRLSQRTDRFEEDFAGLHMGSQPRVARQVPSVVAASVAAIAWRLAATLLEGRGPD